MKHLIVAVVVLLACASVASAQSVPNPTKAEYTVSVDHAQLSKYVVGYFLAGATDPVQTADLPLLPPDPTGKVTQPINAVPLAFGTYVARIKAVAGAYESEWSSASNEFSRVPFSPSGVVVAK